VDEILYCRLEERDFRQGHVHAKLNSNHQKRLVASVRIYDAAPRNLTIRYRGDFPRQAKSNCRVEEIDI